MRYEDHPNPVYPRSIAFCQALVTDPPGSRRTLEVAISPEPALWLKALDVQIPPHIMSAIMDLPEVSIFHHDTYLYVCMRAVIKTCPCPETAALVQQWVDDFWMNCLSPVFAMKSVNLNLSHLL